MAGVTGSIPVAPTIAEADISLAHSREAHYETASHGSRSPYGHSAERRTPMLTRILAVALAVGSLALATAHAQTPPTTPGSNQTQQQMAPSSEKTKPMGTTDMSGPNQAQQPSGSSSFDPSQYKTKEECLK